MGICAKCKYYEEIEREFQCVLPEYPVNEKSLINKTIVSKMHFDNKEIVGVCNNPKHTKTDFISGESLEKDVELFNEFGQCELFVDIDGEEPIDIPEYPKLQMVFENKELELEEELEIKCYASVKKDGELSYKWFTRKVEESVPNEEPSDNPDEDSQDPDTAEEPVIEWIEGEDNDTYSFKFASEEAGNFIVRCEVTNTDKSCEDRQTSTSYKEIEVIVKEEETEPGDDTEGEDGEKTPDENEDSENKPIEEGQEENSDNNSEYF